MSRKRLIWLCAAVAVVGVLCGHWLRKRGGASAAQIHTPAPVVAQAPGALPPPIAAAPVPANDPSQPQAAYPSPPERVTHPRDAREWQGMLVDVSDPPPCEAVNGCGLGLACIGGQCLPCKTDGQCASGEACVLDHCVPADGVGCRGRDDCADGELCILSGYAATARGNEDLTAYCLSPSGGGEDPAEVADLVEPAEEDTRSPEELGPTVTLPTAVRDHAIEHGAATEER